MHDRGGQLDVAHPLAAHAAMRPFDAATVADQEERLVRKTRVDGRGVGVGDEQHVALVDRLEAANARAVESEAFLEAVDLELAERQAEMLPRAGEIDESDVDDLDAFSLRALDYLARAGLASGLCRYCHHTLLNLI